jgi:uncharacterized membrane protein (UPF0182 family)
VRIPSDLPSRRPSQRRERRVSNRARIILVVLALLLLVLFLSARGIAGFYTDFLWFDSLGQRGVFTRILGAKIALGLLFTFGFALLSVLNLTLADRVSPAPLPEGADEAIVERYRELVGRRVWLVRIGLSLLLGLIAGAPASSQWKEWLLFTHAVKFGVNDPQFGQDVSLYVFRLPFLTFVVDWLFAAFVIILIVTAVAYYLNGGIRLQVQHRRVSSQVKLHISILLAVLALLKAVGYWLQRFELTASTRGAVKGATYTDVKAQLPALQLLAIISLLAAALLIVNVWQRGWRLPVIAVGLWVLVAIVAGTVYPAFVQRFVVQPAESRREKPYIDRNIDFTRKAFNLDNVTSQDYPVQTLDDKAVSAGQSAIANARLMDPSIVIQTFQRQQELAGYYLFRDLDVDRYQIDGKLQQVVLAVRELNRNNIPTTTWEARHLAYTHGYGVAFAPASQVRGDGSPDYLDDSKGGDGPLLSQPAVYFGEGLDSYSVVATERDEISYNNDNSSYTGTGGVKMSSTVRRAAFALRFGEYNLLGSGLIKKNSRIIYIRDVKQRVQTLAPFLDFDADPYPVIIDGRITWVIDGYTTSSRYPYAENADTDQLDPASGLRHTFNYVRNSVKATVDAYNGTVKFYIVDPTDPIVTAWSKAFPRLFTPQDQIPVELTAHFRYPEDLFRVQTNMYARYHVNDATQFFQRDQFWSVAQEPPQTVDPASAQITTSSTNNGITTTTTRAARFSPYYTLLDLPGSTTPQFSLVRPFVPFSETDERKNLIALMAVSSDPGSYGKLRVLNVKAPEQIDGPALVDSNIKRKYAADFTLQSQTGSKVRLGDLQAIPIGKSILWVRPWFVQAEQTPTPQLVYVTVAYGDNIVRARSLEGALALAFPDAKINFSTVVGPITSVVPTTPAPGTGTTGTGTTGTGTTPSTSTAPPSTSPATVGDLLDQATQLYADANKALRSDPPDFTTYNKDIQKAFELVAQAEKLAGGPVATTTPPTTAPGETSPTDTTAST